MSQYMTGTVDVTSGSATVAGLGTAWVANVTVGDLFMVNNIYTHYEVASIPSDTSLVLNANWAGSTLTGQSYQVVRDFTPIYDLLEVSPGDRNWAFNITKTFRMIDLLLSTATSGYTVVDHTDETNVTLDSDDFNKIHIFSTATTKCTVTLPSIATADIGKWLKLRKAGAGEVEVVAADSDTLIDTGTQINNAYPTELSALLDIYVEIATHWGFGSAPFGRWTTS